MAHPTHHSMKAAGRRSHERKKAEHRAEGGAVGDKKQDEKLIKRAMREHDEQQHEGKHTRIKLKDGGAVEGEAAATRLDRPGHAKGGRTKAGAKGGKTHVNVIVAPQNHPAPPVAGPMPGMPPHPMPAPPPPAPPPGAGPPGAPGVGGPPMMPPHAGPPVGAGVPMMHNAGGRVGRASGGMVGPAEDGKMKPDDMPGGGSGAGRLEKIKDYGTKKTGEDVHDVDPDKDTAAPRRKGGRA